MDLFSILPGEKSKWQAFDWKSPVNRSTKVFSAYWSTESIFEDVGNERDGGVPNESCDGWQSLTYNCWSCTWVDYGQCESLGASFLRLVQIICRGDSYHHLMNASKASLFWINLECYTSLGGCRGNYTAWIASYGERWVITTGRHLSDSICQCLCCTKDGVRLITNYVQSVAVYNAWVYCYRKRLSFSVAGQFKRVINSESVSIRSNTEIGCWIYVDLHRGWIKTDVWVSCAWRGLKNLN